jgi:hypothetical protein
VAVAEGWPPRLPASTFASPAPLPAARAACRHDVQDVVLVGGGQVIEPVLLWCCSGAQFPRRPV